jgi:hypothetical protein
MEHLVQILQQQLTSIDSSNQTSKEAIEVLERKIE